jgi:hypothetical protein
MALTLLQFVLFGFMNTLASYFERFPLIQSFGHESAGNHPAWLFVSSMRLTASGLTRYFVPDKILPIKSISFVQHAG